MFRCVSIFVVGAGLALAQSGHGRADGKQPPRPSEPVPSASAKPAEPVTIPAGASETSRGTYKHTDSSGKKWIYRKTPFGIVKSADNGATEPQAGTEKNAARRESPFAGGRTATAASTPIASAVEDGDTIRFERSTPFGPTRWTRKRSELNADEMRILEQSRTRNSDRAGTNK